MERWRKPAIPVAIETDSSEYVLHYDGSWRKHVDVTLRPEDWQRLKEGRVCLNCLEPQEVPFPEVCSLVGCGFQIRRDQARLLEHEFRGEKDVGGSTTLREELDRLDDFAEKNAWKSKGGVIVPKNVR